MRPPADIAGRRFGRLLVIRRVPTRAGRTRWLCLCDCGKEHEASTDSLMQGLVRSCGCLRREESAARAKTAHKRAAARRGRLRVVYADPATLRPQDRPTGAPLRVDPAAVNDLLAAMGLA